MGVFPVRLAVALHELFPPLHRLPLFIACSLKDGLPSSAMKRTKKKNYTKYSKQVWLMLLHQGQQTYNSPAPPSRRASQDRQGDNGSKMCFSPLKTEHISFALYKVTDKVKNIPRAIICILALLLTKLFVSSHRLLRSQSKVGIKRRAIQISSSVIHYDLHRATCAQTLIYPDWAGELNLIIFRGNDHKSALNL